MTTTAKDRKADEKVCWDKGHDWDHAEYPDWTCTRCGITYSRARAHEG